MPRPLALEWEPGSEIVGDFTWVGGTRTAVKRAVYDALARTFHGIEASGIKMVQDPKLKQPKRRSSRSKPRVWLPYTGPELVELWPTRLIPFLPATTFEVAWCCEVCGYEPRQITGVEVKQHRYNRDLGILEPDIKPRAPGKGVFVSVSDVGDTPIFRLAELTGPLLCTDRVKSFIQEQGFTNVDFCEHGDIVDR
jgi:hypothetical protein